jgi:hypothetical protein
MTLDIFFIIAFTAYNNGAYLVLPFLILKVAVIIVSNSSAVVFFKQNTKL